MQASDARSIIGRGDQIVPLGTTKHGEPIELEIELRTTAKGLELSICGNVWQRNRRDIVQGGQMQDSILDQLSTAIVPRETVARIVEIWNAWHLNGMRAGCEHQRAERWDTRPIDPSKPTNTYGKHFPEQRQDSWNMLAWVRRDEHPEGLLSYPCPSCGYKYGSAWLMEPLPQNIVDEITAFVAQYGKRND